MLQLLSPVPLPWWRSTGVLFLTELTASLDIAKIFYGNGQSVLVPSVTAITLVGLKVDENYVGRTDQLYSELVNVSVTTGE